MHSSCFNIAHSGDLALDDVSVVKSSTNSNSTTGTMGTDAILAVDTSMGEMLMEQKE